MGGCRLCFVEIEGPKGPVTACSEVVEEGILLKPVTVVEKKKAWENAFQAIEEVEDRQPNQHQTLKDQEEEIADMVKDFRQHHE